MIGNWASLQRAKELHKILLLRPRELGVEHEIEEFHRVLQGEQAPLAKVWRRILDAPAGEGFDRTIRSCHHGVDQLGFVEALYFEVVHQVIRVERWLVAYGALTFT